MLYMLSFNNYRSDTLFTFRRSRWLILGVAMLFCSDILGQRFKTSESNIRFFSDAPLEDIEAFNDASTSIIDIEKMTMVVVIPIKSFDFQKELMQEHFNENYLESDKYPNAVFKGKIEGWDGSDGSHAAKAVGTLEMHGVTNDVTIDGQLEKEKNDVKLSTVFTIKIADYDIDIPKAVFYKIAEEVEVTANFAYQPYEKK